MSVNFIVGKEMDKLIKRPCQSDFSFACPSPPLDAIKPLPCDRWLASSALQKAIRRSEVLVAQRALRTLYRHDPRAAWRRLLVIACEDVGIGSLDAVTTAIRLGTDAKACREAGGDEAAALATAQMLAEAPKDRSTDMLYAAAQHDPALEVLRKTCRSVPVTRRLEFVAEPTLSLPERALAAWHSSGVDPRGEQCLSPGDFGALLLTYAELGVPERLLTAVAAATHKIRDPLALFLPLLWLAADGGDSTLIEAPPWPSDLIEGVPLYALDKHTPVSGVRPSGASSERTPRSQSFCLSLNAAPVTTGRCAWRSSTPTARSPGRPCGGGARQNSQPSASQRISVASMSTPTSAPPWCDGSAHSLEISTQSVTGC
jgi:MgsA AAA+ ATPase C terminal